MAWSDAARAAAAEVRRRHAKNLHTEIVRGIGGVNKSLTIAGLRSATAASMRRNKAVFKGLPPSTRNPALYMAAQANVRLMKSNMMRGMAKLHPMYSKGLSVKKMFGK